MNLKRDDVGLRRKIAVVLSDACRNSTEIDPSIHSFALQGVIAIVSGEMGQLPRVCGWQNCPFSTCSLRERRSPDDTKAGAELYRCKRAATHLH